MLSRIGRALMAGVLGGGLVGVSAVTFAASAPSPAVFTVLVGGSSAKGNISSYNYYPDVVTIDAGDQVRWVEGSGVHTVMIGPIGVQLPPPGSPPTLKPAGGSVFNGSTVESSGIMLPGQTYALQFTKPGVYRYQCGVHPDMVGAVVVEPAGTALPFTPAQALKASRGQMQLDLNTGEAAKAQALAAVHTTPGANGTLVYHVWTDLPSPSQWTVPLTTQAGTAIGSAVFAMGGTPGMSVSVSLTGHPNSQYRADIQLGASSSQGRMIHPLSAVKTNAKGIGQSTTVLAKVATIPGNIWFVDVKAGNHVVASGQVNYPQFGSLRYWPGVLKIHAGDTVKWTQNDFHEAHTVTILAPGQSVLQAEKFIGQAKGGNVINGPGFVNSGLLWKGMSYQLTFNKPGTYHYLCLLHYNLGMVGTIVVQPKA